MSEAWDCQAEDESHSSLAIFHQRSEVITTRVYTGCIFLHFTPKKKRKAARLPFTNCINASPLIAPPAPIALVSRLVMSFTPRTAEDFICPQRVGHLAFSDSWGRETRRRQAAESKKAAETGSPATLMCWGKKKKRKERKTVRGPRWETERERVEKEWKKGEEGEGWKTGLWAQRRGENRWIEIAIGKMPTGETGAVLPAPSSSCQRQGWRCHSASALCSIHSSRSF